MNEWNGIGNLTKDPVLKETKSEKSVCEYTIAVKADYTNKRDYIPITTFDKQADNDMLYLKKGSRVAITGPVKVFSRKTATGWYNKTYIAPEKVRYIDGKAEEELLPSEDDVPAEFAPEDGEMEKFDTEENMFKGEE